MPTKSISMFFGGIPIVPVKKAAPRPKETFTFSIGKSSLGLVLIASSEYGLVSVLSGTNKTEMMERVQKRFSKVLFREDMVGNKRAMAEVVKHIDNPRSKFNLPIDMRGTEFQQRVWKAVRKIPPGQTSTYTDIATAIGAPRAVRAVGSTCTNNPFFIVIPCHRVLHKGESLAHFGKASKRHQMLIKRETNTKN